MILLLLALCLSITQNYAVQVKVKQGLLKGAVVANEVDGSNIYSFKGIPYAQPPVGNLRFKAPQPISSWRGVRNATEHGSICPQFDFITGEIRPGNEDCLFLNVYTPNLNPKSPLSVIMFIHGGSYISGSGNDAFYGPDFIVRKNVILVTINYRLGDLGFLTLDIKDVPGNAAMKDQVMALKWVNDNIRNFGGDPKQITIVGQSAGSASVLYHLASPLTKGLFQRAIALSGTPTCDFNFAYKPTRRPYILAKHLGYDTSNPEAVLKFLQSVQYERLIKPDLSLLATEAVSANDILRTFYFQPVVEKKFGGEQYLTENYLDVVKKGGLHDVDLFVGSTNLETAFIADNLNNTFKELNKYLEAFVPHEILDQVVPDVSLEIADLTVQHYFGNNKTLTMRNIIEYLIYSSDTYFTAPIRRFADIVSDKLSNVYFYKFVSFSSRNYYGKLVVPYGLYVASHLDDLNYFMNPKSLNLTIDINSVEFEMIELMTNVITNFVKSGTPTPDDSLGLIWPTYDAANKNYVTISNVTLICGCNPDSSGTAFRKRIFKKAGINYYVAHAIAIQVEVSEGLLEGEVLANEVDGSTLYSFKGIPYAQPPVGNLRFKAPQPITTWDGVKNATQHGATCPQFDILSSQTIPGDEDCLFLNIYTSDLNSNASLPVMFFIHGGGYVSGSGNDDFFGGDFVVRKKVILVTINYRLGDLGFLTLDTEEVPGNAGMKDQVLALKWVYDNIKNFGGDPDQITIIGQSAGGASVLYHLASPLTKGLFKRAIALSGTPTCDFNYSYKPTRRPYILAKLLGNATTDPETTLEFLQSVNVSSLIQPNVSMLATEAVSSGNIMRYYYFHPVVENNFGTDQYLTENYLEIAKNGNLHDVELYLGSTNLETAVTASSIDSILTELNKYPESLVPREILNQVTPDVGLDIADKTVQHYYGNKSLTVENIEENLIYSSETYFTGAIRRFADLLTEKLSKIYFYKFASYSSRNYYGQAAVPYGLYVASHLDDLMYFMYPKSLNLTVDTNSTEFQMVELTTNVITNFVKHGTPTPDDSLGLIWPTYDTTNKSYVTISNVTLIPDCDPDSSAVAFRNSIFENTGINY